jgi:AP2 domain/HNH endonuclease
MRVTSEIASQPVTLSERRMSAMNHKIIPLTKGFVTIVDEDDYDYLIQWKWTYNQGYALRGQKKKEYLYKRKTIMMHRIIMNAPEDKEVDHKNLNGLDNRKQNLRIATYAQNKYNALKRNQKTSSKYKGVSWKIDKNKWEVYIKLSGKKVHIGYFNNEIDAAKAYNKAAEKYYKEFSRINVFI